MWPRELLCAAVGATIGLIVTGVAAGILLATHGAGPAASPQAFTLGAVVALLCALSLPAGWWSMYRHAMRQDAERAA